MNINVSLQHFPNPPTKPARNPPFVISAHPCRAALALQQHALVVPHGLHGGRHQQRILLFQLQTRPRDDHGLKRWREKIPGK